MGVYKRGRPKKVNYESARELPHKPGEYRIRDAEDNIKYVGETNDLERRAREHKKTGKFSEDSTLEYMVASDWTTSADRRKHERRSIEKHKPYMNKSIGGEGRPAIESQTFDFDTLGERVMEKKKTRGNIALWIVLAFLAVALGFGAKKLLPSAVSHDRSIDVRLLNSEIKKINELATLQYDYRETIYKKKDGKLDNMFIATFDGTIKAGINMDDVDYDVQNPEKDSDDPVVVNVAVPKATILSHEDSNPETLYYTGYKTKGLGKERNNEIKKVKEKKIKEFIDKGHLDDAKEKAEDTIEDFIHTAYGEDVVVNFSNKQ